MNRRRWFGFGTTAAKDVVAVGGVDGGPAEGLDLEVAEGEFVVLVGPSGCGKTTTLRMIAGLEAVSGGRILIGDREVNDVAPAKRDIAMVFQNYALYPHMTVRQNMGFALKMRKTPRHEIAARVAEAAQLLGLEALLDRRPSALSGGQRQRVALARAIVRKPQAFLFDEPLSNLDARLRLSTRGELKSLHQRLKTTTVYVTHDQEEAMTLGDRIVVMADGVIQQADPPMTVYERPANRFVAGFVGTPPMNFVPGRIRRSGDRCEFVPTGAASGIGLQPGYPVQDGQEVVLGARPQALEPVRSALDGDWRAVVQVVEPLGESIDLSVKFFSGEVSTDLLVRGPSSFACKPGDVVFLRPSKERIHLFEPGLRGAAIVPGHLKN